MTNIGGDYSLVHKLFSDPSVLPTTLGGTNENITSPANWTEDILRSLESNLSSWVFTLKV
jgi:hypothetical protein